MSVYFLEDRIQCHQPSEIFTVLDAAEQYDAGEGIEEHQQEHPHDDKEAFEHRDDNRKH